ncbi:MAG: response regulator [Chitinispirillales bacterium]|jgi:signal transduction histidine kinase/DNA-binding response OmpR family regulator|nr:response regulator [Chitinispirillales bacterium]
MSKIIKKIRSKWHLYVELLFTAVAFSVMVALSYGFIRGIISNHLIKNAEYLIAFELANIETYLAEPRGTLSIFSETVNVMLANGSGKDELKIYINSFTSSIFSSEEIKTRYGGFYGYFETLAEEPVYLDGEDWIPPADYIPEERPWYKAAVEANGAIAESQPYMDAMTGETVLTYSRSIRNAQGENIAVVAIDVYVDVIGAHVVKIALANNSYGFLFNKDLVVFAHPSDYYKSKHISKLHPTIAVLENDLKNGAVISQRSVLSYKNEKSLAFFKQAPNGWYLGIITPEKPYYASITYMMWVLSGLGLTMAAVLGYVLVRMDKAKDRADLESKHKSMFLANMSHEIRTPMNAIVGMTLIGKSAQNVERKDYCLTKIEDASQHLLGVINDILDISKIESGVLELSPEEFNFEKMLQRVVNVINFRADEKKQKFSVYIDRNIPRCLTGDKQRLAQVITNLLGNAVKFTPENGSVTLDASCLGEDDGVCKLKISVTDTGIGISPEKQAQLFQPFFQAESDTVRRFGGTGLGLSISKSIVEMMDGKIWLESEIGKGSTFSFTVRMKRGTRITERIPVVLDNVSILVVDDDPDILEYFKEVTNGAGLKCDTALCGDDALKLVDLNGSYNVYFVDWKMPGLDGISLSKVLKAKASSPENTIVIMISAAVGWADIENEAKAAGVDKFLSKPLFPSSIMDTISEVVSIKKEQLQSVVIPDNKGIFENHHILLVEDVEINREIVISLLEETLVKIDCAENGIEAVRMFKESPDKYDMIFMDIQMPFMDGYEATRRIRALDTVRAKTIPVIALTANVFREDMEKCVSSGMNDYLGKPIDYDDTIARLRKYLI